MADALSALLPAGVTLDPVLPPGAVGLGLAAGLIAVAWIALSTRPRRAVTALEWAVRSALLVALAVLVLNPQRLEGGDGADAAARPEIRLIVDRSASMATTDAPGGRTRAAFIAETWVDPLMEKGPAWARDAQVEVVGFDERMISTGDVSGEGNTSLLAALDAALAASPARSAVLAASPAGPTRRPRRSCCSATAVRPSPPTPPVPCCTPTSASGCGWPGPAAWRCTR